ncbi:MAG: tripartite tricarboxylate transporter TctB family protein [Clostridium sp.]|nr:tripartite tricarboxylate transporter TctB family protein [Clostridiaceae bacterium]
MGETIFLLCFCAAAIAMYGMTGNFRISKMDTSGGAAMFPRIVIILLLVFLAIRLLQIWIGKQKKPFMGRELFTGSRFFFLICFCAYVVCLKLLGYRVATYLFLLFSVNGFMKVEKGTYGTARELVVRNLILLVFVLAMYWLFGTVLSIKLPTGFWA